MRNFTKFLIGSFLFPFIYTASYGAVIFVDKNLSSNCLSGNYSIAGRNCSGADGNAYSTIQSALNSMNGGDDIYLRGGTYKEGSIIVPSNKNGSASNYSSLKSYINEWAIIDGNNNTSTADPIWGAAIGRNSGLSYWEFGHFEIKNGRNGTYNSASNAAGITYGGDHGYLHHLYIHDNSCYSGANNSAGIKLEKTRYVTVEYCFLYNNGDYRASNLNASNIVQVSDYIEDPLAVNINNAAHHNVYRYNLIEHSTIGFKNKNSQWLSKTRNGQTNPPDNTYKQCGDKIYCNIIKDISRFPLYARMDFVQIYNNIIDVSTLSTKESCIGASDEDDRHPFYATVYNNTFINSKVSFYHDGVSGGDNSSYTISASSPAKPYFYFYNNIIDSVGAELSGQTILIFFLLTVNGT